MKALGFFVLFGVLLPIFSQDEITISVKGISDANKDGRQKDRLEAIVDAKRQACEKAGIKIESSTKVEDFQVKHDLIESQARAVLLPGFQIIDIGYVADGTYNVVLTGKVKGTLEKPVAKKESALFTIMVWLKMGNKPEKSDYLDKLYEWLGYAYGTVVFDGRTLDKYESELIRILKGDSLNYRKENLYAFEFRVPTGDFSYAQRTPTRNGGVSRHDFALKIRAGKSYVMEVAYPNALYFKRARRFDGTLSETRNFGQYPGDFEVVHKSVPK